MAAMTCGCTCDDPSSVIDLDSQGQNFPMRCHCTMCGPATTASSTGKQCDARLIALAGVVQASFLGHDIARISPVDGLMSLPVFCGVCKDHSDNIQKVTHFFEGLPKARPKRPRKEGKAQEAKRMKRAHIQLLLQRP